MTLAEVMAAERDALMAEYLFQEPGWPRQDVPPYCAIPDFEALERTPTLLRGRHPIRIEELPGKKPGEAFVQLCPSLGYRFLWAHVDNDDYRDDYVEFLRKHHSMILDSLPGSLHVDHLFNRARAKVMELKFIRMILLPGGFNMSHGAGYEKSRTRSGVGRAGRERSIDEIVLMKLWGVSSPRKRMPLTPQMSAHAHRMAALFGLPVGEIERNIRELMAVAASESSS